jgi:serine protease Do
VIVEYGGRPVARSSDLPRAVADTPVGREVPLSVLRGGKRLTLTARIARLEEPAHPAIRTAKAKASLGLGVESLTPARARELGLADRHGVLVQAVKDGSPRRMPASSRGTSSSRPTITRSGALTS